MSNNSARGGAGNTLKKQNPLTLTGGVAAKRNSVAPGVKGGLVGLKFNKPSEYKDKSSENNESMKESDKEVNT
jgi:hypothetical protein